MTFFSVNPVTVLQHFPWKLCNFPNNFVSSTSMQSHIGRNCLTFLHCAFLNVSSNCLPEKRHSHTDYICLLFSTVSYQMFPQIDCPRRCKVTLAGFVWLEHFRQLLGPFYQCFEGFFKICDAMLPVICSSVLGQTRLQTLQVKQMQPVWICLCRKFIRFGDAVCPLEDA